MTNLGTGSMRPPAMMEEIGVPPVKARNIQREHIRQRHLCSFIKGAVSVPHVFQSFDAAKKSSAQAWQREKARGVVPGAADTLLSVAGMPDIWIELKDRGKKPDRDGNQERFGNAMRAIGRLWFWADSICGVYRQLKSIGVPMSAAAEHWAEHFDAKADEDIRKKEVGRTSTVRKKAAPRKARPRFVGSKGFGKRVRGAGFL